MADNNQTAEEKYAIPLPKQVRDQMAQVEAMMQPPRDPDDEDQEGDEGGENEGQEGEEGQEGQEGEGRPPPQQAEQPPELSWEQRARSTIGRLEAQITANQALSKRVQDLETELRNGQQPQPGPPSAAPSFVKPEEINDYGEEFMDVVGRRAKEIAMSELSVYDKRIQQLENSQKQVGTVIEKTQKRTVYDQLRDAVPDWGDINHHPAFHEWLSIPDPYSGRQRKEMLAEAFTRHDGNRVVNFFQGFLTEATGLPSNAPRQNGHSAPPLANGNGSGKPSLEDFAAPGRARSGPQQLPPDKPTYTTAQIAKISNDKRRGLWRGREAELEALERDIFAAQHEGRLQP